MSTPTINVEKIANLARIDLSELDISLYTRHLSDILTFVEQMNNVDTSSIMEMAHPLDA